jgi:hypothetical protein
MVELKRLLTHVDRSVTARQDMHVICDSSSTYKTLSSSSGWPSILASSCSSPDLRFTANLIEHWFAEPKPHGCMVTPSRLVA